MQRRAAWDRLRELTRRGARRPGALSPPELDELVDGYLATSADLASVRASGLAPELAEELTRTVAEASAVVYGTSARSRGGLRTFVTVQFPAAAWAMRLQVAVAAAALLVPAVLLGVFIATDDRVLPTIGSDQELQRFVEEDFTDYYTDNPNPVFAAMVGTNNIQVGLLAFGAGVLGGLPSLYVLAFNGLNVGVAGGIIHAYGRPDIFWYSILPHGLLEISAILVSGAAGIRLGWAVLAPGDRRRSAAVAEEGQRAAVVMLGLVAAFALAALIEGFVTPRTWHPAVEIGIGALALLAFVLPVLRLGPAAQAAVEQLRGPAGGARIVGDRSLSAEVWQRPTDEA